MSVSYTLRMPDDLRRLIAQAAKSGGVSDAQLVIDACWRYLDGCSASSLSPSPTAQLAGIAPSGYPGPLKPDMAALRDICAGTVPVHRHGNYDPLVEMRQIQLCNTCESPMREVKGKWACQDVSCGKYGVEQKIR